MKRSFTPFAMIVGLASLAVTAAAFGDDGVINRSPEEQQLYHIHLKNLAQIKQLKLSLAEMKKSSANCQSDQSGVASVKPDQHQGSGSGAGDATGSGSTLDNGASGQAPCDPSDPHYNATACQYTH